MDENVQTQETMNKLKIQALAVVRVINVCNAHTDKNVNANEQNSVV